MKRVQLIPLYLILTAILLVAVGIYTKETTATPPASHPAGAYAIQSSGGGANPVNPLVAATTTPCAIAGPQSATSSIMHYALTINVGTSSAATFAVGTSTSPYATSTTPFATFTVGAGSQKTFTWDAGVNNDQMFPGTYIVAGLTNGSAVSYGYTFGGTCSTVLVAD